MTALRGVRSAITPAASSVGTRAANRLANTNPRADGVRSTDRTANAKATGTRPSPKRDSALARKTLRKTDSLSGPTFRRSP